MPSNVFIGSSKNGLTAAKALQVALQQRQNIHPEVWTNDVFAIAGNTMLSLIDRAPAYDFAVLVVTPDDALQGVGSTVFVPRDNVILELGLFLGVLGKERCFIAYDTSGNPKLPSDLNGVTYAPFHEQPDAHSGNTNWPASITAPAALIENRINALGPRVKTHRLTPDLETAFEQLRDSASAVFRFEHVGFIRELTLRMKDWAAESAEWRVGKMSVQKDYVTMLCDVYRAARNTIFSTCIPKYLPMFENTVYGNTIIAAQTGNRDVQATRVFVFDRKGDEEPHKAVLKEHRDEGIRVLLYFDKDDRNFSFPPTVGQDWTVVDNGDVIGVTRKFGRKYEACWYFQDPIHSRTFAGYVERLTAESVEFTG